MIRRIYFDGDEEIIVYRDTIESLAPGLCVVLVGYRWTSDRGLANRWEPMAKAIGEDLDMLKRRQDWKDGADS